MDYIGLMLFAPAIFGFSTRTWFKVEFTTIIARRNLLLGAGLARRGVLGLVLALACFASFAAGTEESKHERVGTPVLDPQKALAEAEAAYRQKPRDEKAAWEYAKACFDVADVASSRKDRARYAQLGIAVTKKASQIHTNSGPIYYYLGLNYGQLARSKGIGALKLLGPMRQALEKARTLEPSFDFAGPDRSLGLLYRDAPGWTVGDRKLAKECLLRTIALAPAYPDNHLELISAYMEWGERERAREQLSEFEKRIPQAKSELEGPEWALAWEVWEQRLGELKQRLGQS